MKTTLLLSFVLTIALIACKPKPAVIEDLRKAPFRMADRIEVVAFPTLKDPYNNDSRIKNGHYSGEPLLERIVLNKAQIDTLYSILAFPDSVEKGVVDCYNPHHAILFYKQNKPVSYIEICFDCHESKSSADVEAGLVTYWQFGKIYRFFKQVGIRQELLPPEDEKWLCREL